MVDLSSIHEAAILNGLTEPDLEKIGAIAYEKETRKGDRLFSRGMDADTFYIVKEGRFALTVMLRVLDGEVEAAIEEIVAGGALGWSALVEPHVSIYSAYCTEDGSVAALPGGDMEALMSSDEGIGHRFSRSLSELVGSRVRVLQDLWIQEIQQSMLRVSFWTHTKTSRDWETAVRPPRKHSFSSRKSSG
jgi:CRP-like cAMP-binding protein